MLISSIFRAASLPLRSGIRMPMKMMPYRTFATTSSSGSDGSVIDEIKQDHRELEEYYGKYKSAKNVEESHKWFNMFLWEICRHSVAEEVVVYNLMEAKDDRGKQLAEESREDHRKLKVKLEDLRKETDEKKFEEKFDAVFKDLQEHITKEEGEDLAYLKEKYSDTVLKTTGTVFNLKKKIAPTRPHPEIPDKPTAVELGLGLLVTPIDKLKDLFTPFPEEKK